MWKSCCADPVEIGNVEARAEPSSRFVRTIAEKFEHDR